ncbi:hypothetical protein [Lutibacter sp.]
MKEKEERFKNIISNLGVSGKKEISENKFIDLHSFDFEIINSIENETTDFEFNDFKDLQNLIKKTIKNVNFYNDLEKLKNRLNNKNIDYRTTFYLRIVTS